MSPGQRAHINVLKSREGLHYNDPAFHVAELPSEESACEVAFAVRDYILGDTPNLTIELSEIADYGPVFTGARLAMQDGDNRYLLSHGASGRLKEITEAINRVVRATKRKSHSSMKAKADRPSDVYLEHLRGPVLSYILDGIAPEAGVYEPRRVQKVLQALGGTDFLNEATVMERYIHVQRFLSAGSRVHDYDPAKVGRYREPTSLGRRPEWSDESACAYQKDPNIFFPEDGTTLQALQAICAICTRKDDCLEIALVNNEDYGVWGGVSMRGLRKIRKAIKQGESEEAIRSLIAKQRGQKPSSRLDVEDLDKELDEALEEDDNLAELALQLNP